MAGQNVTCFCPGLLKPNQGLRDPVRIFGFSSLNLPQDGQQKSLALKACQGQAHL